MKRISPVLVLLVAAGCANAGIADWLNPFRMFGGNKPAGTAVGATGAHHDAKGHRGPRQLYPASGPSHSPLGSPAGHLDDGFKPNFPPGFSAPPSHSPNVNPFAVDGSNGPAGGHGKGPLYPSQLTLQHTPGQGHYGSASAAPSYKPSRPRGLFGFRGRAPSPPAGHPHAAAATIGGPSDDNGPDGAPAYDFNRPLSGSPQGEYDESHHGGPPSPHGAPVGGPIRGPPSFHRPGPGGRPQGHSGAPPSFAGGRPQQGAPQHFGRPLHAGPGAGPPEGHNGRPSFLDSGSEGPYGRPGGPTSGPPGGRPGSDAPFFAQSPGGSSPFSGGPPGSQSPGGPNPFSGGPPGSQSPFANPQQGSPFGQEPSEGLFGGEGAPQGPPGPQNNGLGSLNGPQAFFGNGNEYPEQFEGGNRDTREPQQLSPGDYRPQPNGPPAGLGIGPPTESTDEQSPGFYGALHNSDHAPLSNLFGGGGEPQGQQGNPNEGSQGQYLGGGPQGGPQLFGQNAPSQHGGHSYPPQQHAPHQRPRKPLVRLGIRNALANAFQSSSSNVLQYHGAPLMMSASGSKPSILPVPKTRSILRPFVRKPGSIIPLSSPRDPHYNPMALGSSLRPVTASFEPDTAASGGHHGGFGDVGLSHNGDRILYHVAGHQGPYSYRFGFDTGKGYNRLFRFEEKDGKGFVKGKYGFYDKSGKLNVINYQAHPKHGYHAERGHSHGYY